MAERLFYCGTAPPPRDAGRATQLWLAGPLANINRGIEVIEKHMVSEVPNHLRDLLDIATYVFVADRMVRRGGETLPNMGRDWRRRFRLFIAVREPERWNDLHLRAPLEELIGFVSEDHYRIEFVKSYDPPDFPVRLPLQSGDVPPPRHDQILLFSGGLDSLAGAVRELSQTCDRVVLVSHRSSDWVFSRQKELAQALSFRFPGQVQHVPVEVTMTNAQCDVEHTQRTRSFLFFAIGCVMAEMLGSDRIRFFENGIISFNLPIAPQIVGSRATRSTHPLALSQMTAFAKHALGHHFEVSNPFIWLTKAEVISLIGVHGQANLIARSISCTHIRKAGPRPHCGDCTQCLQRRFGILAAGLADKDPAEGYQMELLTQERDARSMALNVVSSALEYPRLSLAGFMNRYAGEVLRAARAFSGDTVDGIVQKTYELHRRYGSEVGSVIDEAIRENAPAIRERTLATGCLLRAVVADDRVTIDRTPLEIPDPGPRFESDFRDFHRTDHIHVTLDEGRKQVVIDGLGDVGTTGHFHLLSILAARHRADRNAELRPGNYAFTPVEKLMDGLGVRQRDSSPTANKQVQEKHCETGSTEMGDAARSQLRSREQVRRWLPPESAIVLIDPSELR